MHNVTVKFNDTLLFNVWFEVIQNRFNHFVASISCCYHQWRERLTILFDYLLGNMKTKQTKHTIGWYFFCKLSDSGKFECTLMWQPNWFTINTFVLMHLKRLLLDRFAEFKRVTNYEWGGYSRWGHCHSSDVNSIIAFCFVSHWNMTCGSERKIPSIIKINELRVCANDDIVFLWAKK